ncbi:MAG: GDP-mannose 4,6-dehydratase [Candidatus Daviesbacteria bacterium]|nr:GDP-mannose 4,6-dehydratase [Candidatus Daviesbacteria bacterium]
MIDKQRVALLTGITGMDGSNLAEFLVNKGYTVYGMVRRVSEPNIRKIEHLLDKITLLPGDLTDQTSIDNVMRHVMPTEIYHLGAQSFVQESWNSPESTGNINGLGTLRTLNSMRQICPTARFYNAASSEMFGKVKEIPQTENTPFHPRSPYGVSKVTAFEYTRNYRESYGLFCCNGILFNHEGKNRGIEFVTKKITDAVARIRYGLQDKLVLGNLSSKRDWGHSANYIEAMWLMLQQDKPDDYVIATGEAHTVREFVEESFKVAGVDITWKGEGIDEKGYGSNNEVLVEVSPQFYRPAEVDILLGDASKAKEKLGWSPKTTFKELVKEMTLYDLERHWR